MLIFFAYVKYLVSENSLLLTRESTIQMCSHREKVTMGSEYKQKIQHFKREVTNKIVFGGNYKQKAYIIDK